MTSQEFNNPGYNFSSFQKKFIEKTASSSMFNNWVQAELGKEKRPRRWFCFIWYTKEGVLNTQRVGVKLLLSEVCTA